MLRQSFIRKRFSVVGERIVYELRGVSCIDLESATSKKNIMCSKSFGTLLTKREQIEEALANYAARACEKLRQQQSKAQGIYVFLRTNPFRQTPPPISKWADAWVCPPHIRYRIYHSPRKKAAHVPIPDRIPISKVRHHALRPRPPRDQTG